MLDHDDADRTTPEKVAQFKATEPLLSAMLEELRKFALKKPEATLSKQKVFIVNRLLTDLQKVLADERNSKYLDLLTDDDLPQYSDAVLILSQYEAALQSFRARYYGWDGSDSVWFLEGGEHMEAMEDE